MFQQSISLSPLHKGLKAKLDEIQAEIEQLDLGLPLSGQEELIRNIHRNYQDYILLLQEYDMACVEKIAACENKIVTEFFNETIVFDEACSETFKSQIYGVTFQLVALTEGQDLLQRLNQYNKGEAETSKKIYFTKGKNLSIDYQTDETKILIRVPDDLYEKNPRVYASDKGELAFSIPFILVAHELIHCLHILDGNNSRSAVFPAKPATALFQLYNNGIFADAEEFKTIEGEDGLSENTIRDEYGVCLRRSHKAASLSEQTQFTSLALLGSLLNGLDTSSLYIPEKFSPPPLLNYLLSANKSPSKDPICTLM